MILNEKNHGFLECMHRYAFSKKNIFAQVIKDYEKISIANGQNIVSFYNSGYKECMLKISTQSIKRYRFHTVLTVIRTNS